MGIGLCLWQEMLWAKVNSLLTKTCKIFSLREYATSEEPTEVISVFPRPEFLIYAVPTLYIL